MPDPANANDADDASSATGADRPDSAAQPPAAQPPAPEPRRRTLVDLSPLRVSPAFARLWIGQSIAGIGAWLTMTAVGLLVFDITQSTFMVGLVGGIALLPMNAAGLWGGMLADAFDRRALALITSILSWLSTITLLGIAVWDSLLIPAGERAEVWPIYIATTVNAVATTMTSATRSAAIPRILPPEYVSRATALNGLTIGLQLTIGPALAGVMIAGLGFPITFLIDAILFSAGFIGIFGLPKLPPLSDVAKPGLQSFLDGVKFMREAPNIRMSFIVDIIAMTLGRPHALFPAIGAVAIGGGAITVGLLTAAMAVGTLSTGIFSGRVASINRHGIAVSRAIMVYGGFTIMLGLVILFGMLGFFGPVGEGFDEVAWAGLILAIIALIGLGASDEVSAIFRATMMLTAVPDEMRGRTQGLFMVVVAGGPRLGDLYVGIVAAAIALWAPSLIGGIVIVAAIAVLLRFSPGWRAYDARNPTP